MWDVGGVGLTQAAFSLTFHMLSGLPDTPASQSAGSLGLPDDKQAQDECPGQGQLCQPSEEISCWV